MTKSTLSRRDFLKLGSLTMGAAVFTCCGAGYLATLSPPVSTPELNFGKENQMNQSVLITYATRAGSTAEIAAVMGEVMAARGFNVQVVPVKEKPSLTGYDCVLIGSAIRMGKWLPEAVDFVKENQRVLNQMPIALFTVHMLNLAEDETSRAARFAYLQEVRPLLNHAEEVYFAGKMDFSRLSFLDRLIAKMVKAVESDQRDWDKIQNWAKAVFA
ncbi:MAG: Protoporphyrinogen IX oxidase, oxygen-independent, HemG [Anaerolineae bacterium]|nr:MAG: Protoporphyrinogen IX oxidase, oxygen-independent, HemG [Anaerolineae bacterium]